MPDKNDGPKSESPEGLAQRVARLEALEEIRDLKARYARGSDRVLTTPSREAAIALADLFTEDGSSDLGPFGRFTGRAELIRAFEEVLPAGTRWSVHYVANPEIEVEGDSARGKWYFLIDAQPKSPPNAPLVKFNGEYQERYRKENGAWKIAELVTVFFAPPPA